MSTKKNKGSNVSYENYKARLQKHVEAVKKNPKIMDKTQHAIRLYLGVGSDTVNRIRYIMETGCSIDEAIEKFSADKTRQASYDAKVKRFKCGKIKQEQDPYSRPMHRPNGVNYLSVAWR